MNLNKPRRRIAMTATVRRQTAPEQRRFEAALELLLTEMVRREIAGRQKGHHGEEQETTR